MLTKISQKNTEIELVILVGRWYDSDITNKKHEYGIMRLTPL